jgi:hypothetical protein
MLEVDLVDERVALANCSVADVGAEDCHRGRRFLVSRGL